MTVPWPLLILVAGFVVRFGTTSHLLGDVLIWVGAGLFVLGFIAFGLFLTLVKNHLP